MAGNIFSFPRFLGVAFEPITLTNFKETPQTFGLEPFSCQKHLERELNKLKHKSIKDLF